MNEEDSVHIKSQLNGAPSHIHGHTNTPGHTNSPSYTCPRVPGVYKLSLDLPLPPKPSVPVSATVHANTSSTGGTECANVSQTCSVAAYKHGTVTVDSLGLVSLKGIAEQVEVFRCQM